MREKPTQLEGKYFQTRGTWRENKSVRWGGDSAGEEKEGD